MVARHPRLAGILMGCAILLALDAMVTCMTGCGLFEPNATQAKKDADTRAAAEAATAAAAAAGALIPQPAGMLISAGIMGVVGALGGSSHQKRKAKRLQHRSNSVPPLPTLTKPRI
jgi:hypothetical protein